MTFFSGFAHEQLSNIVVRGIKLAVIRNLFVFNEVKVTSITHEACHDPN